MRGTPLITEEAVFVSIISLRQVRFWDLMKMKKLAFRSPSRSIPASRATKQTNRKWWRWKRREMVMVVTVKGWVGQKWPRPHLRQNEIKSEGEGVIDDVRVLDMGAWHKGQLSLGSILTS